MRKYVSVLIAFFLIAAILPPVNAEKLDITGDGEYIMGEGETMEVAAEKARRNAIRSAAEQAGTFVRSYSRVQNLSLREDVIEVVASHAMKVSVLDEQTELVGKKSVRFKVKIKAALTTEEVEANIRKARSDLNLVESYKKLQEDYARLARETEELKKKLTQAAGEERRDVLARLGTEEARFRANVLYERGARLNEELKFSEAEEALTQSIALNPDFARAYLVRAFARAARAVDNIEPALADMEKALALEPGNAKFYMTRADILRRGWSMNGCSRMNRKTCDRVLADMDRAISLDPKNSLYHVTKGDLLAEIERFDDAIREMDEALKMGGGEVSADIGVLSAYMMKAKILKDKGDLKASLAELDKTVKIAAAPLFLTSEDRRTLDITRSLYQADASGRAGGPIIGVPDAKSQERERAVFMEKFGIPPEKVDAEMPRVVEKIQRSMVKLEFLVSAYEYRAWTRLELEDYKGGKSDMRKACEWARMRTDPNDRIELCVSGNFEKALDERFSPAGRWLQTGRRLAEQWQSGAETFRNKQQTFDEAMQAYGRAIKLNKCYAEAYEARCNLRFSSGITAGLSEINEKVVADCTEALRCNPNLYTARTIRADVYSSMGQKGKALEEYVKLIELYPENRVPREQRISLLRQLGRFDEAIAAADDLIRKDAEDTHGYRVKAEACEEAGRLLDALNAWEAYVRVWEKLDKKMRGPGEKEIEQLTEGRAKVRELRAKLNAR
jgi:tetratricopeptide (TPR) repeat protein